MSVFVLISFCRASKLPAPTRTSLLSGRLCFTCFLAQYYCVIEYCVWDVCFGRPADPRRGCFKHKRPAISVNLKKCLDWEKALMERFLRYSTLFLLHDFFSSYKRLHHGTQIEFINTNILLFLHLEGYEQIRWTVLCCEENSHQKSLKGWLHEGGASMFHQYSLYISKSRDIMYWYLHYFVLLQVLREVKVLSSLLHMNVVGYHTAWMEHVQPASCEYCGLGWNNRTYAPLSLKNNSSFIFYHKWGLMWKASVLQILSLSFRRCSPLNNWTGGISVHLLLPDKRHINWYWWWCL